MITPDLIRAQITEIRHHIGTPAFETFIKVFREADGDQSGVAFLATAAFGDMNAIEVYAAGMVYLGYMLAKAEEEIEGLERLDV